MKKVYSILDTIKIDVSNITASQGAELIEKIGLDEGCEAYGKK